MSSCEIATQRLPAALLKAKEVRSLSEDLAWMMMTVARAYD